MNDESQITEQRNWVELSDPAALPKKPTVSVLMLAYRHEQYLAEAIEGVLLQKTHFPIELVIAEDCSPDQTRAIAENYQRDYPALIRIITSDSNVGMNANLIRAYEACRGEYIAVCEGDDYWIDPNKLATQAATLSIRHDIDLAFHSTYTRNFNAKELAGPFRAVSTKDVVIPVTDVIAGDGEFIPTPSLFIRKSAINRIPDGMMQSAPIGDYILQVYGSLRGGAFYINRPMSVYRQAHPESWSASIKITKKQIDFEKAFIKLVNQMDNDLKLYRASFCTLIFNHYFSRYVTSVINKDQQLKSELKAALQSRFNEYGLKRRIKFKIASSFGPLGLTTLRSARLTIGKILNLKHALARFSTLSGDRKL